MSFKSLVLENEYRTSVVNITKQFYTPILKEAIKYDRAVGFFSSTALVHIADGLLPFVNNEGQIRIVASPKLSEDDIEAISLGYEKREKVILGALQRELYEPKSFMESKRLNLLSNLIADGYLDIRIVLTSTNNKYGMYHEKMGIFYDDLGNIIAFSGSMNETITAMEANYETIDVFQSWKNNEDTARIKNKIDAFERIWSGTEQGIETMHFQELKDCLVEKYKIEPLNYKLEYTEDYTSLDTNCTILEDSKDNVFGARIPSEYTLYDYQIEAIDMWEKNNYCGIFDMATGTGKTITGLGAVARLSEEVSDNLAVIIVCPYQHLVEQWVEDIIKFNIQPIIAYSGSPSKDWRRQLEDAIRNQKLKIRGKSFFCLVTTNATFSSTYLQQQINRIQSEKLLVVDEAHNLGAENQRKLMSESFKYRLALSATLERKGDIEGTKALYDYFGDKCIEYSLERAIREHKLTPYKYYPVLVSLSEAERISYEEITQQMKRCIIKEKSGKIKLNEKGKKLALKRSRLVSGAIEKLAALEKYIQPYIKDKHILVYCGATNILEEGKEFSTVDEEDIRQIDAVTSLLGNKLGMNVSQFTSREKIAERNLLRKEFEGGDILQALIAIKCLDEGVNIPQIKVAFILASTTNPKEYIQRRGRVLRLAKGKEYAEIYDFITLPRALDEVHSLTAEQMKQELTLVKNELCRAEEFASIALNSLQASIIIDEIKEAYNLQDYIYDFKEECYADYD